MRENCVSVSFYDFLNLSDGQAEFLSQRLKADAVDKAALQDCAVSLRV